MYAGMKERRRKKTTSNEGKVDGERMGRACVANNKKRYVYTCMNITIRQLNKGREICRYIGLSINQASNTAKKIVRSRYTSKQQFNQ